MHPVSTQYYLATSPRDYRWCRALYKAADPEAPEHTFSFPTIMAIRDGKLIGCLSTTTKHKSVIAGPLVVDPTLKQPIFVGIRLVEAYEQVLRQAGVSSYLFHVDKTKQQWLASIDRSGFLRYGEGESAYWYKREVA